jgi:hypothetical protein
MMAVGLSAWDGGENTQVFAVPSRILAIFTNRNAREAKTSSVRCLPIDPFRVVGHSGLSSTCERNPARQTDQNPKFANGILIKKFRTDEFEALKLGPALI